MSGFAEGPATSDYLTQFHDYVKSVIARARREGGVLDSQFAHLFDGTVRDERICAFVAFLAKPEEEALREVARATPEQLCELGLAAA